MRTTNFNKVTELASNDFFIGMDVHKKSWTITIRSADLFLENFTQPPCAQTLINHLHHKYPHDAKFFSAYEAGFCGTSIHEQLSKAGIQNIIVNPADIPATDKEKKNKTDLHDSRTIAKNLEKGTLTGIYIFSQPLQQLRALNRIRALRVKDLTRANNRLKSFLKYFDISYAVACTNKNDKITARTLRYLQHVTLTTPAGTMALNEYLKAFTYQRKELYTISKLIRQQVQQYFLNEYQLLLSIPGIGATTALALITEIGDFKRFHNPDDFASFLGLLPRANGSGNNNDRTRGLQPRCNRRLRPLLVEAAWTAIRKDHLLLAYYKIHAHKDPKYAIIKVARKLAMIVKGVLKQQQPYDTNYANKKIAAERSNDLTATAVTPISQGT